VRPEVPVEIRSEIFAVFCIFRVLQRQSILDLPSARLSWHNFTFGLLYAAELDFPSHTGICKDAGFGSKNLCIARLPASDSAATSALVWNDPEDHTLSSCSCTKVIGQRKRSISDGATIVCIVYLEIEPTRHGRSFVTLTCRGEASTRTVPSRLRLSTQRLRRH
jgi:hypothetical protein